MRVKQLTKKDWIIFWCFLAVVAIIVVCVAPLPVSRELAFRGALVDQNGTVLEKCDFTVKYTKLNYLIREDCYKEISVDVGDMHFDTEMYTDNISPNTLLDSRYEWISIICYNAKANIVGDMADICFGEDWQWCFVRAREVYDTEYQYFVGSLDENADLQSILAYCEVFLN
jgi:hypothetical protein